MVSRTPTIARWLLALSLTLTFVIVASSCLAPGNSDAAVPETTAPDDYPGGDILVSVDWLAEHVDDPNLRVVSLSEIDTYRDGHIPGSVHIWWQDTIETHNDVYGMMAGEDTRRTLFRQAGIDENSMVVVYDDAGGRHAARLLWLLNAVGFENVALLNGGRQAWEAAGYDLTTDDPDVSTEPISQEINYGVLIGADDVQAAIDDPNAVIIDGRSEEQREETWFARLRVGKIPGSVHLPWDETIGDGGAFLPPDELQTMLPEDLEPGSGRPVIVYGLHGVAAGHTYVTLRLLGFENVRLYDGSWAQWGADHSRPIEPLS